MKVNNLMTSIMAVSLLIFTASCEEENESLQGDNTGNTGNNTESTDTHEAVDLGLSVKWATCNVGATSPEDYGGYYAWGETDEKDTYTQENYKYWSDNDNDGMFDEGEINLPRIICGTEYDVAHVKWGNGWRMPKASELEELVEECTWEWNFDGGFIVTGPNGNKIFLPAAGWGGRNGISEKNEEGYYSSGISTFYNDDEYGEATPFTFGLGFSHQDSDYYIDEDDSWTGSSIRPVIE